MKGTLEDAYTVAPQHMDNVLIGMLTTKTRNLIKDALKDDSVEFSEAVPDSACRAAIITANSRIS
jgi:hypothetical protein